MEQAAKGLSEWQVELRVPELTVSYLDRSSEGATHWHNDERDYDHVRDIHGGKSGHRRNDSGAHKSKGKVRISESVAFGDEAAGERVVSFLCKDLCLSLSQTRDPAAGTFPKYLLGTHLSVSAFQLTNHLKQCEFPVVVQCTEVAAVSSSTSISSSSSSSSSLGSKHRAPVFDFNFKRSFLVCGEKQSGIPPLLRTYTWQKFSVTFPSK